MNSIPVYVLVVFTADKAAPILEGSNVYNACAHGHKCTVHPTQLYMWRADDGALQKNSKHDMWMPWETHLMASGQILCWVCRSMKTHPNRFGSFFLSSGTEKARELNFCGQDRRYLSHFYWPRNSSEKVYVGSIFALFPKKWDTQTFSRGPTWGLGWGPKSLCWICLCALSAILGNVRWRSWLWWSQFGWYAHTCVLVPFPPKHAIARQSIPEHSWGGGLSRGLCGMTSMLLTGLSTRSCLCDQACPPCMLSLGS